MTRFTTFTAACALAAAASTAAYADCAADLAEMTGGSGASAHDGISKDGSLAPLQTEGSGTDMTTSAQETDVEEPDSANGEIAKDGTGAPLNQTGLGEGTAMSGQDAQAQQETGATAGGASGDQASSERDSLIEEARTALENGDEAACQDAVDKAANL